MKLLLCRKCHDVFKLDYDIRSCKCEEVSGYYEENGLMAYYSGEGAVPIGFANSSLVHAAVNQPEGGDRGRVFEAFIIPKKCDNFQKVDTV